MSPDDTSEDQAARRSNLYTSDMGAHTQVRRGQAPNLKRGRPSRSGHDLGHSDTGAGHSRRCVGGHNHTNNTDSGVQAYTSALMQRKWCQVHQVPMTEEGGSKAGPPPAPELEISNHFDLGALGDVLISARQDDSVSALAMLALERVVLPQGVTATMILSKCELYDNGGSKYALPYFPMGLAVGAAGLTFGAKVFVRGHHCINVAPSGRPAMRALLFALLSCFDPRLGHIKPPTAHQRHGLDPRAQLIGRGDTYDIHRSPARDAKLLSMDIFILGGTAKHSAWRRIEEDTSRGFVGSDLQQALAAARQQFMRDRRQTKHAGSIVSSMQYHGLCAETPARSVLRNMHTSVRQAGVTTFKLEASDSSLLHTTAGQEFQSMLLFSKDELEHLRRTWVSLFHWSQWCLHTGDLTDMSLAQVVFVCDDVQPVLPPLCWALVHQSLHQRGLDNDDTSDEEKTVICLWTALAVRACLEWQCSLCAVYAHSLQPLLSQETLVHPSATPRYVDAMVFPAGCITYDAQRASTLAEDFLHTLPLSNLPAPASGRIALLSRLADNNGRRRLRIATLYGEEACGVGICRTSRNACTVTVALRLRRLCWACLPLWLWGKHAAGAWFHFSNFAEFSPYSTNLDSAHDAIAAHQLPFEAQEIHDLTYTFLIISSRAL